MQAESSLMQALGEADRWQMLAVAAKTLTYGACFAAAGGVFFIALFSARLSEQENRAQAKFVLLSALVAIALAVLRIAIASATMTGDVAGLLDIKMMRMVVESPEGTATALRLGGLLLTAVMVGVRLREGARSPGLTLTCALLGALLAATSFSMVGHASEVGGGAGMSVWAQAVLSLHLLAVAFWLGALWPLRQTTYSENTDKIGAVMERFGKIAAMAVALLIAAGILLLWLIVARPSDLWTSPYGQLVLVKLFAVSLLLSLAAMNKLRLTPALMRGDRAAGIRSLRRSITVEIVLAGAILLVTAAFTTVVGPPGAPDGRP